ncbi:MAG: ribonuclease E/G [Micavibrio sp.]|nr:ribonuclease E/G [Micavibrio sp.]
MTKKMLIDATHEEETRVAVVDNGRLAEFEYESAFRKPLKGNIFLAKVTRVEPSLQAAFVNYGGNRHGFLPFSEIHPDYFRIPIADREALIAEQEAAMQDEEDDLDDENLDGESNDDDSENNLEVVEDDAHEVIEELGGDAGSDDSDDAKGSKGKKPVETSVKKSKSSKKDEAENASEEDEAIGNTIEDDSEDDVNGNVIDDVSEDDENNGNRRDRNNNGRGRRGRNGRGRNNNGRGGGRNAAYRSKRVETVGGDEDDGGDSRFRYNIRRKYKIQEVIKRGQIMLIQVSKEERGNKGAAVSSYLSLPGRYCVLMPNSPRAGGVSRKISNYQDRAKMRDMMKELEVPKGMSVILRTAGVTRTKTEVKRDLDYLMRLWDNIRGLTMESTAPAMVYEEADLVKRSVRDLYTRDIDEIIVAGNEGFKTAKNFMKMMIPSHVKRVVDYKNDQQTLFNKFKIEEQIADIGETSVNLKSGGYLIINPTEALVSIDVNSGKATKERHIEETALKTNLEAAEEVARQLRLRDLGGLIVIDFIDMEDRRNNAKVERKMRDALSGDKARIQMGRISSFGLMEMSRQRMSASLGESQFETCKHCEGSGRTRTADAASILVLRDIEAECIKGRAAEIMVHVSSAVAIYVLNNKRQNMSDLEARYDVRICIRVDETLGASGARVEVSKPKSKGGNDDDADIEDVQDENERQSSSKNKESGDEQSGERKRQRRGRRGGRRRNNRDKDRTNDNEEQSSDSDSVQDKDDSKSDKSDDNKGNQSEEKKTSRPRRSSKSTESKDEDVKKDTAADKKEEKSEAKAETAEKDEKKKPAKAPSKAKTAKPKEKTEEKSEAEKPKKLAKKETKKEEKPATKKTAAKKASASNDDKPATPPTPKEYEKVNEAPVNKKKGWWNKLVD